jgi:hypothetical protein
MLSSTDEIFRVRSKDHASFMNPIYRDALERGPLANYYFSFEDALARITDFIHDEIENWEIVTLTQMMSEDAVLKKLMEKHGKSLQPNPNHTSEPLHLIQQNEQVQNALRKLALGTPQVDTMTVDEFDALLTTFESLSCLNSQEKRDAQTRWRTAFMQHRKESLTYVRSVHD